MAHLEVNGLRIPGAADTFEEVPDFVGEHSKRAIDGSYQESHVARSSTWTCKTVYTKPDVGTALTKWLGGDGHSFDFASSAYSGKGLGPKSGSAYTRSASGGKHAARITVSSGGVFELALRRRMSIPEGWDPTTHGWTVFTWKKVGSSFTHYLATGAVVVTRGASGGNPAGVAQFEDGVAGSFAIGNWLSVGADGDVAIHGRANAGTNAATDYSGLVVLPYRVPAEWVPSIHAFHDEREWPRLPRLHLSGDAFEVPVSAHGRASKSAQRGIVLGGTHYNNARVIDVSLFRA